MNNQIPNPDQTPPAGPSTYPDWHEQRRAERWASREAHWQRYAGDHYAWIAGVNLIVLGSIFLLQNLGIPFLRNWWALFFLIPASWAYMGAWSIYQHHGRMTRGAAGSLTMGILLTIFVVCLLFNLAVGLYWPVVLIAGGLVLLGTSFLPA